MTNEEAKQKKIKEAWGETTYQFMDSVMASQEFNFYRGFKEYGEVYGNFVPEQAKCMLRGDHITNMNGWYKPKSLMGLEDNNGWTRIELGGDLPQLDCDYKFIWVDGNYGESNLGGLKALVKGKKITHYRPIQEIPPPLY